MFLTIFHTFRDLLMKRKSIDDVLLKRIFSYRLTILVYVT